MNTVMDPEHWTETLRCYVKSSAIYLLVAKGAEDAKTPTPSFTKFQGEGGHGRYPWRRDLSGVSRPL